MSRFSFAFALLALLALVASIAATQGLADDAAPPTDTTTTGTTTTATTPATTTTVPAPAPALAKSRPKAARTTAHVQTVFPAAGQLLVHDVAARTGPSPAARVIRTMHQFRDDYRIQEILAVATKIGTDRKPWYKISIPMRPNGTMGWIPARSVSLSPTVSQIVIHRAARTIDVYWNGKHALHAIVAIGAPHMETPLGHFYVAARFVPYEDPFLGVFAVETSAYSKLTEWPGGGVVGIHGTSMPQLLGQAVSHGCVRVSNTTAAALRKLAPLGTPIWITE
jgi:lipoprotein-anchoring transpeptidase ErfK/SrfK